MDRNASPDKVILGMGVFSIGATPVGLTRGGGQFTIEREYRAIAADGDRGKYKGRIAMDTSIPKLKLSMLEIITNIASAYPGFSSTPSDPVGNTTVTGTGAIAATDYKDVTWTGKTKAGKSVVITVKDAINLDNPDFTLVEKDEVVAAVTFEGTYPEDAEDDYEPWTIVYAD